MHCIFVYVQLLLDRLIKYLCGYLFINLKNNDVIIDVINFDVLLNWAYCVLKKQKAF